MRREWRSLVVFALALTGLHAAGCSTGDAGLALQARGGTYVDGTGRLGLALLTTLRDEDGAGPSAEWSGSLSGPAGPVGGTVAYSGAGPGSWSASWWPEEPSYGGTYSLELAPAGGAGLAAGFEVGGGAGIAPPRPSLSEASPSISWDAVPGAAAYECRVYDDAGIALRWLGSATTCDLSALPAGAYAASVLAYSADLVAIAASASPRPALPDRFDVSEARLALRRDGGEAPAAVLGAAGGGFHDGTSWPERGLAVWISILNPDGSPTAVPWTVEVVGPGLPPAAPMRFTYPANFSRLMLWAAAVPASPGSYGLVARSSAGAIGRPFTIGALPTIDAPTGIVASAGAQGSGSVTWSAVPGANHDFAYTSSSGPGDQENPDTLRSRRTCSARPSTRRRARSHMSRWAKYKFASSGPLARQTSPMRAKISRQLRCWDDDRQEESLGVSRGRGAKRGRHSPDKHG